MDIQAANTALSVFLVLIILTGLWTLVHKLTRSSMRSKTQNDGYKQLPNGVKPPDSKKLPII